jgi:hypothetical protein
MKQEYMLLNEMSGYLVLQSSPPPSSPEEIFANAVVEHLKHHDNDGMSLFVCSLHGSRHLIKHPREFAVVIG